MMISDEAWCGVHSLLENYVGLRKDDAVVIVYSPDSHEAAAWVSAGISLRGNFLSRVPMQPLTDPTFRANLDAALPDPDEFPGRLVILTFERETMSHDDAIRSVLRRYKTDRCLVFRSISSCNELFEYALHATPDELTGLNTAVLERCMPANRLRITTAGGTDLRVGIDSDRHRWISNRGRWRPGSFVILPAGEVATYPASIEGVLVADFAFNVNAITERSARLVESPVTVEIREGRAVAYSCDDSSIKSFLDECFYKHCAFNVGELGLGTNYRIKSAIHLNSHINERRPGVHIGFGQHNQGNTLPYQCNIHLDLIANGACIWIDDSPQPIDLENLRPSRNEHPDRPRSEDVFSPEASDLEVEDCCGILTNNGLRVFADGQCRDPQSMDGAR
ncbi:MAG: aminopeptidase [Rhodospirillaceae bacterium]|nr:aminopeptidase [Rhodospirillaceae bacterium]